MAKLKNSPVKQSRYDPQANLSFSFKTKSQISELGRIEKKAPNYQNMVQRIPYAMGKGAPMTYSRTPSTWRLANQSAVEATAGGKKTEAIFSKLGFGTVNKKKK